MEGLGSGPTTELEIDWLVASGLRCGFKIGMEMKQVGVGYIVSAPFLYQGGVGARMIREMAESTNNRLHGHRYDLHQLCSKSKYNIDF